MQNQNYESIKSAIRNSRPGLTERELARTAQTEYARRNAHGQPYTSGRRSIAQNREAQYSDIKARLRRTFPQLSERELINRAQAELMSPTTSLKPTETSTRKAIPKTAVKKFSGTKTAVPHSMYSAFQGSITCESTTESLCRKCGKRSKGYSEYSPSTGYGPRKCGYCSAINSVNSGGANV